MGLESIVDGGVVISIPVDGKPREYHFKLKMAGVKHLVLNYGTMDDAYKTFLSIVPKKITNAEGEEVLERFLLTSASIDIMLNWVLACLLWDNPKMTLEDVDNIMDLHNIHLFTQGIAGAFAESMPRGEGRKGPPVKAQ